ncbi:MAG: glycogen/starch/alpha-glucan phosphorylase, partial [Ruminococcaceae bacterium]|nr:glycogen/starch/alpha-glucan phosphorylase [Oscillospiraceae bacterium]
MSNKRNDLLNVLNDTSTRLFSCNINESTEKQLYKTVCTVLREMLAKKRKDFKNDFSSKEKKQVYYMSMEFLVGTSLRNNLYNIGLEEDFRAVLKEQGFNLDSLYELDPDAGLGNGGLGRLASCYMDSATGLDLPVTGFSIRYEFGIFKQKIIDGWQMEFPDNWLERGDVWLQARPDESYEVKFGGRVDEWYDNGQFKAVQTGYQSVIAVPYDMYISGYGSDAVNKLTLWSANVPSFDMHAFSRGEYMRSLEQNTMAGVISKVLYPADNHIEGKRLRLKQQYLLVSASLQSIIAKHMKKYKTLDNLADKVSIHINDTHPALCVPELMRLLMDEHGYSWDNAWDITCKTLSYTNHTVMSEALEKWAEWLFREQLPRVYAIVVEINRRLVEELERAYPGDWAKINYMAPIGDGEVRMANLCLAACHKVNGVSKLHTEILKNSIFNDYYNLDNDRFINVTNGIAYRRWLCQSNPKLTECISELIGDGFKKECTELEKLLAFKDNKDVLDRLADIKRENKIVLANYIAQKNGVNVDPDSIFDVQVKRLHEYKRQLLNVLQILYMYNQIKNNPNADFVPRTFVFGAKASAGYDLAKQIISLISAVSNLVNNDPVIKNRLKVVFLEDYRVSLAEKIIPAAEISEQISIAGKEASGTGNMKFMINGAVTLGTLDGANVEIFEQVGKDNIFLFGMNVDE